MILPNNVAILRNIKDSFYYNGIEISKENFNIQEFSKVCSKVNDIKGQLRQEKALNNYAINSKEDITNGKTWRIPGNGYAGKYE